MRDLGQRDRHALAFPQIRLVCVVREVQQVVGLICLAVDGDAVVAVSVCHKTDAARADRFQPVEVSALCVRDHDAVALAIQEEVHHDRLHPRLTRHVALRLDIDLAAQLVRDPDVALVGVVHQVDRHHRHEARDRLTRCADLRVLIQRSVPGDTQVPVLALDDDADLAASLSKRIVHSLLVLPPFRGSRLLGVCFDVTDRSEDCSIEQVDALRRHDLLVGDHVVRLLDGPHV